MHYDKENMSKKIAIIGGGVAGLSAGIYAERLGYDTTIYEKNSVLGGVTDYKSCQHMLEGWGGFLYNILLLQKTASLERW